LIAPALVSAAQVNDDDLQAYIDGVMGSAIVDNQTVGATVAVVRDGRLAASRGYGMADVALEVPVRSDVSQFRIGSISKVLVWMGVLQQVEAGTLDLDADVNAYLKNFQMPSDFSEPITLRHLMTHTPGFEDSSVGLFVTGPRQVGTLVETLAANVPRRVVPPGSLISYSNYGAALAAHVVSQVTGVSWDDYAQTHILDPLDMTGATTRQPVPKPLVETRAKGYIPSGGVVEEKGFLYVPLAPAGAASATALDMAKLMAELLKPQSSSVLSAQSKTQLMGTARAPHPLVNGLTLGMYEMSLGGPRAVGHGGDTILFSSLMVLWPGQNVGLFVSTNTVGGILVANRLMRSVAQHLGLAASMKTLPGVDNPQHLVGTYVSARRNQSNVSKLLGLVDAVQVAYDEQSQALKITDVLGVAQYHQVQDRVFQKVDGYDRVVFSGDSDAQLSFSNRPVVTYLRAEPHETPQANAIGLGLWFLLSVSAVLVWPISSLTHRRRPSVQGAGAASVLAYTGAAVAIVYMVQLASVGSNAYDILVYGLGEATSLLGYSVALAVLMVVQLMYLPRAWLNGYWWLSRRIHFTLVVAAQGALLGWLWYWNLVPARILDFVNSF
jgi:CubicO group peptidase (beta-lactamase class C family)